MSKVKLPTRMTYPECPLGDSHTGEPLSRVCIDAKCANKTLLCSVCEQVDHKGHTTLPVKMFLESLVQQREILTSSAEPFLNVAEVERVKASCIASIHHKRRELTDRLSELEAKVVAFFDSLELNARNILHAQGPAQRIIDDFMYGAQPDPERIISQFKETLKVFNGDSDKSTGVQKKLEAILQIAIEKEKKLATNLNSISTETTKILDSTSQLFAETVVHIDKGGKFFWSSTLKGAKIKITDAIAEQTATESSGQRFILMEQPLNDGTSRKKTWGIRVKKFGGWIGIGISLHNLIKNANFHFNYTVIGHGSYLISSNGYSWSHSQKEFNSAFKSFTFVVNDVIFIEYDPVALKLRFHKNTSTDPKDHFQLDIVAAPAGDNYHPAANLCNINDSVEVVCPGRPLS